MRRAKKRQKVDSIEKLAVLMQEGSDELRSETRAGFALTNEELRWLKGEVTDIHRTIDRLEERAAEQAGYAKEIDHVLERVSHIEKHLKIA